MSGYMVFSLVFLILGLTAMSLSRQHFKEADAMMSAVVGIAFLIVSSVLAGVWAVQWMLS
jgi:hypothetical protein